MSRQTVLSYLAAIAMIIGFGNFLLSMPQMQASGARELNSADTTRLFVLFLLGMVGGAYLAFVQIAGSLGGTAPPEAAAQRVGAVQASGALRAMGKPGVEIGKTRFSAALVTVSAFPGGIVLKLPFMAERAIVASEIRRVTVGREWWQDKIVVEHLGTGIRSPLVLWESGETPLGAAVRDLEPSREGVSPIVPTKPPRRRLRLAFGVTTTEEPQVPRGVEVLFTVMGLAIGVALCVIGIESIASSRGVFDTLFATAWTGIVIAALGSAIVRLLRRMSG